MNAAKNKPANVTGNTSWAMQQAEVYKRVVRQYADHRPRTLQVHLGPSELGVACDRQIVGKLVREPRTNHVVDPWPSFVGTACHSALDDAFTLDNQLTYASSSMPDGVRWFTERKVDTGLATGTADLYDVHERAVLDHKCLGETTMAKVRSAEGPPRKYVAQLGLYGLGYIREGRQVDRVGLIAWPRTGSSLDGVFVWEKAFDGEMVELLAEVRTDTARRRMWAEAVTTGAARLEDVPREPSHDECYFCPFYRPEAVDGQGGCPGTKMGVA